MKKRKIIIVATSVVVSVLVAAILVAVSYNFILYYSHWAIKDSAEALAEYYSDFSLEKDGYTLKTSIVQDDEYGDYLYFTVSDSGENIIFDSRENNNSNWRISDFKSIKFADDSLDVIVESGDVGTSIFKKDGNGWNLYSE